MYKNNYSETSDDKNSSVTSTAQNELFENNFSETSIENKNNKLFSETSIDSVTSALRSQINFNEDYSETSDNNNLNLSATSDNNDIFISQMGGNVEKTMASPDDINNLINMLTSEPANDNFDTVTTITNTTVLENQLRELLDQAGGAKKKSSKKASKKSSKKASKKASSKKTSKKASKKSSKQ